MYLVKSFIGPNGTYVIEAWLNRATGKYEYKLIDGESIRWIK